MSFLNLMFGFQGRITRSRFWLAALVWVLALPGAFMLAGGIGAAMNLQPGYGPIFALAAAVFIPTLVSIAAVGTKRLHDRDKPGGWVALYFFAPYFLGPFLVLLAPMSENPSDTEIAVWAGVTVLPFYIWGLVDLGILPGTPGPNRFGDAPSGDEAMQAT